MHAEWAVPAGDGRTAHVLFTDRADGDFAIAPEGPDAELERRRRALVDRPWLWLRQVHGQTVVTVTGSEGDGASGLEAVARSAGAEADAAVTDRFDLALAIHTADCAPVALVGDGGVVAAVHAGWRGLEAGILPATMTAMQRAGAGEIRAVLGPCIRAERYEFGPEDLARLVDRFGPTVAATTAAGQPALDVPAAVRVELARAGVVRLDDVGTCTAASTDLYSHRARGDAGRQALVVWIDPVAA